MIATKTRLSPTLQSDALDDPRSASEPCTVAERTAERSLFVCRWLLAPFYLGPGVSLFVLHATLTGVVFSAALAAGNPSLAQRADSNIGLEGGHGGLSDAILATPNRKTPVPQDNRFATAPGATQTAPASQLKKKTLPTPTVRKPTFKGGQQ